MPNEYNQEHWTLTKIIQSIFKNIVELPALLKFSRKLFLCFHLYKIWKSQLPASAQDNHFSKDFLLDFLLTWSVNRGPMISLMVWATKACSSFPAMVRGFGVPDFRFIPPAPVVILIPLDATGKNPMGNVQYTQ